MSASPKVPTASAVPDGAPPKINSPGASMGDSKASRARNKRLIVLCDGTGQSSLAPDEKAPPTNITRLSRALSPYALVNGQEVEQVIYYQPGVGTTDGQLLRGGAYGFGVSANVRAAYAFLAHNYIKGDQIYFFGFSRGAFTARVIAGLVTSLGLLTKRGMDRFPEVYEDFYAHLTASKEKLKKATADFKTIYVDNFDEDFTDEELETHFATYGEIDWFIRPRDDDRNSRGFGYVTFKRHSDAVTAIEKLNGMLVHEKNLYVARAQENICAELKRDLLMNDEIHISAREAVQLIGVFDTVAFHAEGRIGRLLKLILGGAGEQSEMNNVRLSPSVVYGYHALALDEERRPFEPTLWQKPSDVDLAEGVQRKRHKEMQQVWFSGAHSDIGGGLSDPRLSDITLAWMISRCRGDDKLAFIDESPPDQLRKTDGQRYYLTPPLPVQTAEQKQKQAILESQWATCGGANKQPWWQGVVGTLVDFVENLRHRPRPPPKTHQTGQSETNEYIHRSIRDRNMTNPADVKSYWPCKILKGASADNVMFQVVGSAWPLPRAALSSSSSASSDAAPDPKGNHVKDMSYLWLTPPDLQADELEDRFHGRIRRLPLVPISPGRLQT